MRGRWRESGWEFRKTKGEGGAGKERGEEEGKMEGGRKQRKEEGTGKNEGGKEMIEDL